MIKLRRLFLLVFILDLAAFLFISSLPIYNSALYNSFASEDRSITSQAFIPMWLSIFPHNLLIATIEFIPIIGIFLIDYFFCLINSKPLHHSSSVYNKIYL